MIVHPPVVGTCVRRRHLLSGSRKGVSCSNKLERSGVPRLPAAARIKVAQADRVSAPAQALPPGTFDPTFTTY